jgi:hypothetical protein
MHEVEFSRSQIVAKAAPDEVLEVIIRERRESRYRRPAFPGAAANELAGLPHGARRRLVVDDRELDSFAPACAQDCLAISHLRHHVNVRVSRQRFGMAPADERYADPLGICGLREHEHSDRVAQAGRRTRRRCGSSAQQVHARRQLG